MIKKIQKIQKISKINERKLNQKILKKYQQPHKIFPRIKGMKNKNKDGCTIQ
jgi:hypothetical protein